ncbi:PepSY-like domain-containing protein [Dokdonia sp. Hel_I_53]|uniref:PepSY-like domain-containing protein n=1 Tax=Dokdonia sp. Hel_I_53 TaxID=1566287 RepID=UPI0011999EFB|nr:PepSY-like domain-containing protein [Dokdonia sp. Hel_I_53]TVZ51073.1 putative PepSY-like beta-lactamase-inhibitor [Dokdonia sp. Hel_I_53]
MHRIKIMAIALTVGITVSCGQYVESQNTDKDDAPNEVKATFQNKYPGENDPDWHIDSNGNYESHFKIDGVKHRADFNPNGAWIETEVSIDKNELPEAVIKVINEQFPDEKITEIERVQSAEKGLFYDVEFKRKGKNKDVEINKFGKIIN